MSRYNIILSALFACILVMFAHGSAQAQSVIAPPTTTTTTTTTVHHNIVTPVPAAKETIAIPLGSVVCFTVDAAWIDDVWIPQHRVCQYANQPAGIVWVEGYWACTKYAADTGVCNTWDWKAAHWEKTLIVY